KIAPSGAYFVRGERIKRLRALRGDSKTGAMLKASEVGSRKFSARKLFVTESPSLREYKIAPSGAYFVRGERIKRLRALRGDSNGGALLCAPQKRA
ncbi:hypothetical protein K2Q16_03010, partial [Patescibacteria group bacterium]|nr:hypothetical protein [Patescibacteria group bacterium]